MSALLPSYSERKYRKELMRIIQVSAEFAPFAKAGGMGEVVMGLSRELTHLGHQVDIIVPKYDFVELKKFQNVSLEVPDFKCLEKGTLHANAMWSARTEGCHLHFLEARHPAGYFHRGRIYGFEDDTRRFIYFCRAVLEYLKLCGEKIDILHLHDWHTALCAILARDLFHLPIGGIVLTLHNMEYQGRCAPWDLDDIGLKGKRYLTPELMQDNDPDCPGVINLLKGGLVYADALNAVSPTYAQEILTPKGGLCLDKTLYKHRSKLSGILNGIDRHLWDPAEDIHLTAHFTPTTPLASIHLAKQKLRESLQARFNLDSTKRPWIGAVTRLVPQKGPELLEEAVRQVPALGGTFLLLGSISDPKTHARFERLKKGMEKNGQLLLQFEYDESLAHQIFGALDYLLIPSHFEPCGLTQLIGMRYGSVPIGRATGGLKDTIFDCEDCNIPEPRRNGLLFHEPTAHCLNATLIRAIKLFRDTPATFQELMRRGIAGNYTWEKPALQYLALYAKVLKT